MTAPEPPAPDPGHPAGPEPAPDRAADPGPGPEPAGGLPAGPPPGGRPPGGQPGPMFPTLEAWMDGYFFPVFQRPLGAYRWCPKWWAHPEAVTRFTALWRTWESYRLDPNSGISDWLRDHLDLHLAMLLDQRGPFYQCDPAGGHVPPREMPREEVDWDFLLGEEPR